MVSFSPFSPFGHKLKQNYKFGPRKRDFGQEGPSMLHAVLTG